MSVATLPKKPAAPPVESVPLEPPAENFWEKWSPNYEFQISSVATGAIHVVVVALVIFITTRLMKQEELPAVPTRGVTVIDPVIGGIGGEAGSGGGDLKAEVNDERRRDLPRPIPAAELPQRIEIAKTFFEIKDQHPEDIKALAESLNSDKMFKSNEDAKRVIKQGFERRPGEGENKGAGASKEPGTGSGPGGVGDATSSGNRSSRWNITFRTSSGADYLKQLAFFEAKLLIPEPPTFQKNRYFDDLSTPNAGKPQGDVALPGMSFIDDNKNSARKIAAALGLDFAPPEFYAFFPKKIEDELAAKERAYRNRKEEQISSTTFSIIERNGTYEIKVTDQVAKRR